METEQSCCRTGIIAWNIEQSMHRGDVLRVEYCRCIVGHARSQRDFNAVLKSTETDSGIFRRVLQRLGWF